MITKAVSKIFRGFGYFVTTIMSKIQYGNKLKVDGEFRKRKDTQIIISEKGKCNLARVCCFSGISLCLQ